MAQVTFKVIDRRTGEMYDVIPEAVDINFDGKYHLRYRVGIQGHSEFHFICAIYDDEKFNNMYQVIEEV